jgi:hypothetical protein
MLPIPPTALKSSVLGNHIPASICFLSWAGFPDQGFGKLPTRVSSIGCGGFGGDGLGLVGFVPPLCKGDGGLLIPNGSANLKFPGPSPAGPSGGDFVPKLLPTSAICTGLTPLASLIQSSNGFTTSDAKGQYAKAEPLYGRALAICEKALGPEHPDVATSLNNLAGLYANQGRYAKVESLYQRALAIYEEALGPEHPDVVARLENYALCLRAMGRFQEADPLEARAHAIRAKNV